MAMVVPEQLSPDRRVAFVLHDGFAVLFADIAGLVAGNQRGRRATAGPVGP